MLNQSESGQIADLTILEQYFGTDPSVYSDLLGLFFETSEKNLQTLHDNIVDGESSEWVEAAHSLKGGSKMVGARRLSELAETSQKIENAIGTVRRYHFVAMEREYEKVKGFLAQTYGVGS